jgi:hypothetical protein
MKTAPADAKLFTGLTGILKNLSGTLYNKITMELKGETG